jgi:tetratricopeptide (TPR) repeat protein
LDIDTRSDIYSLGVLLYELLTGCTPFDKERLRSAAFDEMMRIIREEEPPKPSTRLSTLDTLPSVAAKRKTEPKKLSALVHGELDWIVMKALEKDRARRYETANEFANDIQRYLNHEAVAACPPSAGYRFRKFAARNKAIVSTVAAIALLLVGVIAINTALAAWAGRSERLSEQRRGRELQLRTKAEQSKQEEAKQRKQAEIERDKARAAESQAAAQREIARAAEQQAQTDFQRARRAVDQYLQTVSESQLLFRPGMGPLRWRLLESARTFYQTFLDEPTTSEAPQRNTATARYRLGRVLEEQGDRVRAQVEYQAVRPSYEQLVAQRPDDHPLRLELADICHRLGDLEAARQHAEAVLEMDPTHTAARRSLAALHEAAAGQLASRG